MIGRIGILFAAVLLLSGCFEWQSETALVPVSEKVSVTFAPKYRNLDGDVVNLDVRKSSYNDYQISWQENSGETENIGLSIDRIEPSEIALVAPKLSQDQTFFIVEVLVDEYIYYSLVVLDGFENGIVGNIAIYFLNCTSNIASQFSMKKYGSICVFTDYQQVKRAMLMILPWMEDPPFAIAGVKFQKVDE